MSFEFNLRLDQFFNKNLKLPCEEKTRAYIISIFSSPILEKDFTNESVTFALRNAYNEMSFNNFRQLGDYLFFTKSLFPESLKGANIEYYDSVARTSYYKCFLILNKKWPLYEELADEFPTYTKIICKSIRNSSENRFLSRFGKNGIFKIESN